MPEESKEEFKQQVNPASDAPTEDASNKNDDSNSIGREQELPSENTSGEQLDQSANEIDIYKEKLEKLEEERDNYKTAFLKLKSSKRMAELAGDEKEPEPRQEQTVSGTFIENNSVVNDYSSKRADILADYEEKIQALTDDEFRALSKRLRVEEQLLVQDAVNKNSFVAKKHIQQMIDDNLDYINKRYRQQQSQQKFADNIDADIGSTKTNRKLSSQEPINEEIRDIARESGLTPDRVKELKQKGLI